MRICCFQPGATEIVYALGLQDQLYGVTAQCDYPVDAQTKPVIVRSVFDGTNPSSGEISEIISEKLRQGLGLYDTDEAALRAANPDVLLTQALCDV
jgi:iron complex transport system substrate-binding protein